MISQGENGMPDAVKQIVGGYQIALTIARHCAHFSVPEGRAFEVLQGMRALVPCWPDGAAMHEIIQIAYSPATRREIHHG